jgi:hypothetical protein
MLHPLAFAAVIFAVTAAGAFAAPDLPAPPTPKDTAELGKGIQRAMTLMATSTPQMHHKVKVLYYGQSITNQEWTDQVTQYLKDKYPNADFTFAKLSLGGFASQLLVRTTDYDVLPFYPDLMIFHVYGDHRRYEDILIKTLQNTTAEIAIWNDHITKLPVPEGDWSEKMSYDYIPAYAKRYSCYLMDIRRPWKKYLEKNGFEPAKFLKDGVHLNPDGCWLLARLIEPFLVYRPDLPDTAWKDLAHDYVVGKDVQWKDGKLTLPFTGNRVDAYSAWSGTGEAPSAKVLIDGKAPSEFPTVYYHARPSGTPNIGWPAIKHIGWREPLVLETWTATCHDFSDDAKTFRFEVSGSATGPDGQGTSTEEFVSNSGRVVIEPQDWTFDFDREVSKKPIPQTVTVKWQTKAIFTDTYAPLKVEDPAYEYPTTLAQGLPNATHTLELVSETGRPVEVAFIRVYEPPLKDVTPLYEQPHDQ